MNLSYLTNILLFIFGISFCLWEIPRAQSVPQPADSLKLQEITVKATRLSADRRFQPVQISVIDSIEIARFAGNSVADVLETRSQLYIRNNGPGGLATVSMRGLSARQTQVLWNGFNLNHPMLGLTDLSLIPTGMVNRMEIIRGQSATSFGNGAAGGMIWLESNVKGKQAGVQHTTGSFGKSVSAANVSWQEGRWNGGVWLQYEDTDNDFDFQMNRFSNQEGRLIRVTEKRENNHLESVNIMAQAGYQAEKMEIQSLLWFFDTDNQLPGGLQSLSETTRQEDSAIRWMNRAELDLGGSELKIGTMFNRQDLDFFDERSGIESVSRTRAISLDLDWQWQALQSLRVSLFSNAGHTKAETNNFNGNPTQWQFSTGINTIWQPLVPLHLFTGIRYDYFEISGDAISASLGANVNVIEDILFLKTQGSRNFVAPTFNDLFWVPGGNPDLLAETNYKLEGGMQF
ncbi:MAG: TonB-dependent receptor plug domain-containing protein, partial [Balneolaceae bacterium]